MPHIELVIQFMVPSSLSVWMQRAGRAGRSPALQARGVLLVQPSVFQEKHEKGTKVQAEQDGVTTYVKQVEEGLHTWIEAKTCRRGVADQYFNSTVRWKCKSGP